MSSHSLNRRQLSRSKLDLFLECPRCFHEDVVRGNGRPGGPAFTLNIAVDELFKREFDLYSARQEPHPLFASDGRVMVSDYKATAKAQHVTAETLHPAYRRQADVYQFLVAQQGLEVSDRAWFVYANGLKTGDGFHDTLRFDTRLVPYDGGRSCCWRRFAQPHHSACRGRARIPDRSARGVTTPPRGPSDNRSVSRWLDRFLVGASTTHKRPMASFVRPCRTSDAPRL